MSRIRRGDLRLPDRRPVDAGGADAGWALLYRAGAVSAALAVLLYAAALAVVTATGTPPASGGARVLEYVATHRTVYIVRQLLWLTPSLFMMVVALALAVALRHRNRSAAAVAGLVAVTSWAISFAWPATGDGAPALVLLSDRYAAAGTVGERAPFVAGAEVMIALNDVPSAIGVMQTLGILLISLLAFRGPLTAAVARLGTATGAVGLLAEVLRPVLGGAYAIYGLSLFAWLIVVAVALRRHAAATGYLAEPDRAQL